MVSSEAVLNEDSWVEKVKSFLEQSRDELPADVFSLLSEAIDGSHTSLPPRVFYEAVQQSAVAISITDSKAKILYSNPAFTEITGYSMQDVIGKNESILSDNRTPKYIYEDLWEKLVNKQPWTGSLINRRKDGERYVASLTIAPVVNHQGNITHYLGMHRDITEKYRLERELANNRKLIESVVEAAPVIIALLDQAGNVVRKNKAYRELRTQMNGQEPVEYFWRKLTREPSLSCDDFKDYEIRFDPGGGQLPRWFSCSCTQVDEVDTGVDSYFETSNQSYRLLVAKEITEIKRGQEAVRMNALRALMAEDELIQSTRETLGGAIYQLQGPMNMVAAACNMIDRKGKEVSFDSLKRVLREALDAGSNAMDRLSACIPESNIEPSVTINVNDLIQQAIALNTEKLLANGVTVEWKPAPVLSDILGREHRLRNMFNQLIDNAIDAMGERGRKIRELSISTFQEEDDAIRIFIDDTGAGIPEELRYQVFQPFYSTKGKKGKRAGMGLAMVQDVVSEHSGHISISNAPTGGCRLSLLLPIEDVTEGDIL